MDKTGKTFASTRYQHLYRHRSGIYYARITVNRKKTWRSLRTRILGVARSELAELLRGGAQEQGALTRPWRPMRR